MCRTEEQILADKLENEIIALGLVETYQQVLKLAEFTALTVRNVLPMYKGVINVKWKLYDDAIKIIKGRQNNG